MMDTAFRILGCAVLAAAFLLFCWDAPRKWYRLLLRAVLGIAFLWLLSDGFVLAVLKLFGLTPLELRKRELAFWMIVQTGQFLALLGGWTVRQVCIGNTGRYLALSLLLPALSVVMVLIFFFTYLGRTDISVTTFSFFYLLVIVNFVAVALIQRMRKSAALHQEMALLHQQLQIQSESILSLEKSYREQRRSTHDYQSQLQTLWQLLQNQDTAAAREFVGQLLDTGSVRIFSVNSGDPIVDAVLHQKFQTAQEQGIQVSFKCNDLSGIPLEMKELVVLLGNLMDNAIEGCDRCQGEKKLECVLLLEEAMFLSVRNTSPEVKIQGHHIPTSKTPKHAHGFGLKTICRILNQHKAQYSFRWEDHWFEFAAEIPCANLRSNEI